MATSTPSQPPISPHEDVENANRQPAIAGSLPQAFVSSPPLPVEDVEHHHQQFMDSISSNLLPSPENSVDRQQPPPPEDGDDQQETPVPPSPPPKEKIIDREQPFAPPTPATFLSPSTEAEHPPENPNPNHEYPFSKQPPSPSLSPSPPQTEAEYPPENLLPNYESTSENLSRNHESRLSKEPPLPSQSQSPSEAEYQPEKLLPNHESPLSKQLTSPSPTGAEYPSENFRPNYESPSENLSSNHEYSLSKKSPLPSPSTPRTVAEEPVESPSYRLNPNPNSDHESPSSPEVLQGNPNPSPKSIESPKDLSPSPPLITGSPSSQQDTLEPTLTPPLGVPLLLHAAATFSPNKPQISPWTHQETANLIQAYQEKWYSLKKGPLKAGQWEEVAITVAARCGYDEPSKTSKQCRHKIEKLRKRYRSERGKPRSKATAWNFFKLMDNLEKGPLPISSSQPMALVEYQKPSNLNGKKRKNDVYDDDGDHEFHVNKRSSRSWNFNHHVANGGLARNLRFSDSGNRVVRGLRTPVVHKREEIYQEQEENNENGGEEEEDVATQLAAEIKGFAKKFVNMENNKIEMMRDVEKYRLEMENKRIEMILESQQMLVETVNNAFSSSVKTHKLSAS